MWTLVEGSGVSREQLTTFGTRAYDAASDIDGTVSNLMNRLDELPAVSKGEWIARFNTVQSEVRRNLTVMTQALTATGEDSISAAGGFAEGDSQQAQQQAAVEQDIQGIRTDSFRV